MALKTFRPLTPSLRTTVAPDFSEITKKKPERKLIEIIKKTGGRNSYGRLTARHIGGGHKRFYRKIDWKRRRHGESAEVIGIEYDPNRSARIALIEYQDKERAYIISPVGLHVGDKVCSGPDAEPKIGNCLPLSKIPAGMDIHNLELTPGKGSQMCRSAGSKATLMGLDKDYAQIKLPSGEIRKIHASCIATIGQVGNTLHENVVMGKAGRARWKGIRPTVRGMVMNPVDHPNGGGNGKSKGGGGRQHPVSPWGQLAKGYKTRQKHKPSDRFIVAKRKSKKKN